MSTVLVIDCPGTDNNIAVGAGSGSGSCATAAGTICVCGHLQDAFAKPWTLPWLFALLLAPIRWLLRLFKPRSASTTGTNFVRVRVLNNWVAPSSIPSDPRPQQCWDVDAALSGQNWCARGVLVPAASASGAPLTAVAWLMNADGTPVTTCEPASRQFNGGGPNPTDCCSGCGSGAGMPALARDLASHQQLEVAVPDGLNAGLHRALAVDYLTWEVRVQATTYRVCAGPGDGLVVRGPSGTVPAGRVECGPFSAVFPGKVFGSAGDVVVTVA